MHVSGGCRYSLTSNNGVSRCLTGITTEVNKHDIQFLQQCHTASRLSRPCLRKRWANLGSWFVMHTVMHTGPGSPQSRKSLDAGWKLPVAGGQPSYERALLTQLSKESCYSPIGRLCGEIGLGSGADSVPGSSPRRFGAMSRCEPRAKRGRHAETYWTARGECDRGCGSRSHGTGPIP